MKSPLAPHCGSAPHRCCDRDSPTVRAASRASSTWSHRKRAWPVWGLALALACTQVSPARADTPDEQWAFASGLYDQKLWSLAAENLSKFVQANPRHPKAALASYERAAALLRARQNGKTDYAAGAAAYERALRDYPDPKLAGAASFELADAYYNLNQFERAAAFYARFLQTKPNAEQGAEAAYMRGESLYALKKTAPARAAYAQVLVAYPKSRPAPYAQLALGTLAEEGNQLSAAAQAYQAVWTKYPASEVAGEARLRGAGVLLALKKWEPARAQFAAVLGDAKLAKWKQPALQGQADALFGLKKWPEAAQAYREALAEPEPETTGASTSARAGLQMRLADSLFNAKQFAAAAEAYVPLKGSTGRDAANALYFRGRALDEAGRKPEAIAELSALLQRFATHEKAPRAALLLGDLRAEQKDAVGAATAYRLVITKYPKSAQAKEAQSALVDLANSLAGGTPSTSASTSGSVGASDPVVGAGGGGTSTSGGSEVLEKVLRALPSGSAAGSARTRLAQAAYARGDWAQAATLSQGALEAKPDAATLESALYLLGSSQLNQSKSAQASATFARLLAARPKSAVAASAGLGLAWALLDQKKWKPAQEAAHSGLAALQRVGAGDAKSKSDAGARLKLALGEALYGAGDYASASAALATFSGADKEAQAQAAFLAASSFEALKQWKPASSQWARYAQSAAEPTEAARGQLRRGLSLAKLKDATSRTQAMSAFDRALELDPKGETGARALYESAWAATEAKSPAATARWQKLAQSFPDSKLAATAQFQLGESLFEAKKWDAAASAYEVVTQKWGTSEEAPLAWYRRGSALFNAKNWGEAATSFERAASFSRSETATESLFWAGESQVKNGDLKAARPFYERFLALAAKVPAGTSASTSGASEWKKWVPSARLGLGRALVEANEGARAESVLRAGLAGASGSVAAGMNFALAQALGAQGKWKEAATQALKVSALYPRSEWAPQAAWLAAQATEKSGDVAAARILLRAIVDQKPAGEWTAPAQERLNALGAG